jgi:hypothetical protein
MEMFSLSIQSPLDNSALDNSVLTVIRSNLRGQTVHGQNDLDNSVRPLRSSVARAGPSQLQERSFRVLAAADILLTLRSMLRGHNRLDEA